MSHWIFIINDTDKEFGRRMQKKEWPIFSYTVNRNRIRPDDDVVFYKAGVDGQLFLGTATVTSKLKKEDGKKTDSFVTLKDIQIWETPVSIRPLVSKLEFIWNKKLWGHHLQVGVRRLSEKDFQTILKN